MLIPRLRVPSLRIPSGPVASLELFGSRQLAAMPFFVADKLGVACA